MRVRQAPRPCARTSVSGPRRGSLQAAISGHPGSLQRARCRPKAMPAT
jgi:hypothetical protein